MPDIPGIKKERFQTITMMKVYSGKSIDVSIFSRKSFMSTDTALGQNTLFLLMFSKAENVVKWLCYLTQGSKLKKCLVANLRLVTKVWSQL